MATSKFGREPKMETSEPSADKLAHEGMKKGGHAHKKHMAMGGNPMMATAPVARRVPRPASARRRWRRRPARHPGCRTGQPGHSAARSRHPRPCPGRWRRSAAASCRGLRRRAR